MHVARIAGKAMAGTAIDLLSTPGLVDAAKAEFETMRAANVMWEPNYVS